MKVKARDYGLCFCTLIVAQSVLAAGSVVEITLPGTNIFPESITSKADGTLIVGSMGHGNVLRIAAGNELKASAPLRFARDGYWEPALAKSHCPSISVVVVPHATCGDHDNLASD